MLKVTIEINGTPTPIDRSLLAKDLTGVEYPSNCYLDEPDSDGIYQPDPYALAEYEAEQVTIQREEEIAQLAQSVIVDGIEFDMEEGTRKKLGEVITLFTAAGGTPEGFTWRAKDNSMYLVDLPFLIKLGMAYAVEEQQIYNDSFNRKDLIRGVTQEVIDLRS